MAEYLIQDTSLEAIADAINAKTGGSSAMTPAEMAAAIESISGGGGGVQSASGEITLASSDSNTNITVSGLQFKPNAFFVFGSAGETRTRGAMKFCGYFMEWVNMYGGANELNARNLSAAFSNIPDSLFDYDARPSSAYYSIANDGFTIKPAVSNYIFAPGITYYWKAWRFE